MARLRIPLLAMLLAMALAPAAAADVLVGVAGPGHGSHAAAGSEMLRAARQAADRINAQGGVLGERIRIVEADDGCAEREAEQAARALVAQGVTLIVGHPCASAAIAAARVYAQAGVVFIAPATRHPALTEQRAGPAIFRLAGRDDRQGASAGAYLARAFADKRLAVIDDGTRYAKELAAGALAALKKAGRADVLTETIASGQKDYAKLIARLSAAQTQALFFAGFPIEGGLLLRQMRAAHLATVFIGSDALATAQFSETAGEGAEGAGVLLPHDAARTLSKEALREAFPREAPTGSFVAAYASVEAWRAAAQQAQSLKSEAVSAALQQGSFATILGPVSFEANGDADVPSYDAVWWEDGAWRARH